MADVYRESKTAVLLLGYGGPGSLDEVEPFLNYLLPEISGRRPPKEQAKQVVEKYRLIGGSSPLLKITEEQAKALEEKLKSLGREINVYAGMRFWHPLIEEVLEKVVSDKVSKLVVLSLSPFYSELTTGSYFKKVNEVLEMLNASLEVNFVKSWHDNELLIEAFVEKIKAVLAELAWEASKFKLVFSAHSLPESAEKNSVYVKQLEETKSAILERLKISSATLAYQSKGRAEGRWLQPELDAVLEKLAKKDKTKVLLVPLGFASDNIETLYDLDIVCKKKAQSLGLEVSRVSCLNNSAKLIDALAHLVLNIA